MVNRRHSVLASKMEKHIKKAKNKIRFGMSVTVQKGILALAFKSREKFDNLFFQNVWYCRIASPISFNLI